MKKLLSFLLILISALTLVSCGDKDVENEPPKNMVSVGDDTVELPPEVNVVNFALPAELEFPVKTADGEIDLYTATVEELNALSDKECDKVFPSLQDKKDVANIAASVFGELYPDKGVVHDGMTVIIKSNRNAKGLICHAEGSDGKSACLAIDSQTGKIFMVAYLDGIS